MRELVGTRRGRMLAIAATAVAVVLFGGSWFLSGGMPGRPVSEWVLAKPVAHKGLWAPGSQRPENSLAAFAAAANAGHPIELDVQLSADGRVVVFHDYTLSRMTGRGGRLAEMPLAQLRQARLMGGSETIPELADVLNLVDDRVPLFVEIKNEGEVGKLEDAVAKHLSAYGGRAVVMSFNPYSLARVAKTAPRIIRGQLSGSFNNEDLAWYKVFILRNLLMNRVSKPDFIAYEIAQMPNAVTRMQKWRGRPLVGWTAQTPAQYRRMRDYCDQLICDLPALP